MRLRKEGGSRPLEEPGSDVRLAQVLLARLRRGETGQPPEHEHEDELGESWIAPADDEPEPPRA
jgi:hypothetical protein